MVKMFKFQNYAIYPLIKVMTPPDIDFFTEHKNILSKKGYVWFCKFGRNNMKIESLDNCTKVLIIKESKQNGGGVYAAKYDIVKEGTETIENIYPTYYNRISLNKGVWIRLLDIERYSKEELEDDFVVNASGNKVSNILKSMCPAVFLRYNKNN